MNRGPLAAAGLIGVVVGLGVFAVAVLAPTTALAPTTTLGAASAPAPSPTLVPAPTTQLSPTQAPVPPTVPLPTLIPAPMLILAPTVAVATVAASTAPAPAPAPTPTSARAADVQAEIEAAMQAIVPNGSAELIAQGGSLVATYHASQPRTAASTIKLALLIEVLRQQERGALDLSRSVTIRAKDVVGGTGDLQYQVGRTSTLQEVAHQMVLKSDNVAANILVDAVGMASVNATAHANNFPNTFFARHMLDTAAEAAGVENVTSAEDLAGMVHRIVRGTMISPTVSQQALALLDERGRLDNDWLGLNLPGGATLSTSTAP